MFLLCCFDYFLWVGDLVVVGIWFMLRLLFGLIVFVCDLLLCVLFVL